MDMKELLDEDAFDPKKLFNEEEYSTLILDREGFSKKENQTADLVMQLLEKEISREEAEAVFSRLKELNATQLLLQSIKEAKRPSEKARLVAACWETGLDFSSELLFFTELLCQPDFELAVEALTVAENTETVTADQITAALALLKSNPEGPAELKNALTEHLTALKNG
jgi:hypothetical protein